MYTLKIYQLHVQSLNDIDRESASTKENNNYSNPNSDYWRNAYNSTRAGIGKDKTDKYMDPDITNKIDASYRNGELTAQQAGQKLMQARGEGVLKYLKTTEGQEAMERIKMQEEYENPFPYAEY